jgi:hypothetical protein
VVGSIIPITGTDEILTDLNSGKAWSLMDLGDLANCILRGTSVDETAEFLCREVDEVRTKIAELKNRDRVAALAGLELAAGKALAATLRPAHIPPGQRTQQVPTRSRPIDKNIDCPDRIVLAHIVIQHRRKQRALLAIDPGPEPAISQRCSAATMGNDQLDAPHRIAPRHGLFSEQSSDRSSFQHPALGWRIALYLIRVTGQYVTE